MTSALATPALTAGTRFVNGNVLHANAFAWHAPLTVVRLATGYGVVKYVVADRYGRHGYAY